MSGISHASRAETIRPIHSIFYTPQSEIIRLSRRIGAGAEGGVYEIQDRSDLVAKIYHEPPSPERAEKLLVLSRLGNERLFSLSAWPVDVLRCETDGVVAGFVMKKISQAEEVHALHSPKSRLQKFPEASWAFLIYVAANVARAVAAVHDHGFVIGDMNPKNILVTRKSTVYLLDVDSFQVSADGRTYRCEGGFPEYTPPELQGVAFREIDREQEHDYFGLAVVIFQLLFMGRHPFSGRFLGAGEMLLERAIREFRFAYGADAEARKMKQPPGTLALDSMPSPLVRLFRRAFLSADRPQPREWIEPLDALAKSLKKCGLHSGHYYYQELRDCPWCGIETHARVRLFNFLLSGADSQRVHFRLDEIWKEIEDVEAPDAPLIPKDEMLKALRPSADVEAIVRGRRDRFILSLGFSVIAGLAISIPVDFPAASFLFVLVGLVACAIARAEQITAGQLQLLFQRQQAVSGDPLIEKIQARRQQAEDAAQRLQEQCDRNAGNERWGAKRDELRNQKETYENLAQIRRLKFAQSASAGRDDQRGEFLDEFGIDHADIAGIGDAATAALLSHGVVTAADITEERLGQIPVLNESRVKRLLRWRQELERKFEFEPDRGVTPQARIAIEKEIDSLRLHLERELSGGAHYLRRVKQEIETNTRKLRPALVEARRELAQAEKDCEAAGKRNSFELILAALVIAFFIGWAIDSHRGSSIPRDIAIGTPREVSAEQDKTQEEEKAQEALEFYHQGVKLSREEKFTEAAKAFRKAVEIDPKLNLAYEELGYALYSLKKYGESAEALNEAIELHSDFRPFYVLGLVHVKTGNWREAWIAFQQAIFLRDTTTWKDEYTQAYYHLGHSLVKVGEIQKVIRTLEDELDRGSLSVTSRFELANLYLWVGKRKAAREQYEILKNSSSALAEELMTLMKKHAARKPA